MKEKIAKILKWFAKIWGFLIVSSVFVGAIGILIFDGWLKLTEVFSPFNLVNWIMIIILFSPAIGAFYLSEYLSSKEPKSFGEFIKKHKTK